LELLGIGLAGVRSDPSQGSWQTDLHAIRSMINADSLLADSMAAGLKERQVRELRVREGSWEWLGSNMDDDLLP
jgi:hypothetical protein